MNASTLDSLLPDLDFLLSGCLGSGPVLRKDTDSSRILELTPKNSIVEQLLSLRRGEIIRTDEGDVICNGDGTFSVEISDDKWFDTIYSLVSSVETSMAASEWLKSETRSLSVYQKYTLLQALQNPEIQGLQREVQEVLSGFQNWLREG